MLIVSDPMPSCGLTGQLATEFDDEVGGESVDALVDSVVSVGPGTGLILALVFSIIGWVAAGGLAGWQYIAVGRPAVVYAPMNYGPPR